MFCIVEGERDDCVVKGLAVTHVSVQNRRISSACMSVPAPNRKRLRTARSLHRQHHRQGSKLWHPSVGEYKMSSAAPSPNQETDQKTIASTVVYLGSVRLVGRTCSCRGSAVLNIERLTMPLRLAQCWFTMAVHSLPPCRKMVRLFKKSLTIQEIESARDSFTVQLGRERRADALADKHRETNC